MTDVAENSAQPAERPRTSAVLLAPWRHIFAPARAARLFADASPAQFRLAVLLGLLIGTILVGGALFAGQPATDDFPVPGLVLRRTRGGGVFFEFAPQELRDVLHEGPDELLPPAVRFVGSALAVVGAAIAAAAALLVPLAGGSRRWLKAFAAAARAVTAGGGMLALVMLTTIAGWLAQRIVWSWMRGDSGIAPTFQFVADDPASEIYIAMQVLSAAAAFGMIGLLLAWVTRAARAVRPRPGAPGDDGAGMPPTRGPRCEGCGYDLSHPPSDGRCPECGLPSDESLAPGRRRRPSQWESSRTWNAWAADSLAVLLRPRKFYSALALRENAANDLVGCVPDAPVVEQSAAANCEWSPPGAIDAHPSRDREGVRNDWMVRASRPHELQPERAGSPYHPIYSHSRAGAGADRARANRLLTRAARIEEGRPPYAGFAARHYLFIDLGATLWAYAMFNGVVDFGMDGPPPILRQALPILAGTVVTLMAWFFHRLVGWAYDVAARWDRDPPDPAMSDRLISYEAVYTWMLCLWNGTLLTSFALFENWMTAIANALMPPVVGRLPIEPMVMFAGNMLILAGWGWRYWVIMKSVRWASV